MKKNLKVEAEGSELVLKNKVGDYVIIPKNKREKVKQLLSQDCHSCIDSIVEKLPTMSNYAVDGTIVPSTNTEPSPKRVLTEEERKNWESSLKQWVDVNYQGDFQKASDDLKKNPWNSPYAEAAVDVLDWVQSIGSGKITPPADEYGLMKTVNSILEPVMYGVAGEGVIMAGKGFLRAHSALDKALDVVHKDTANNLKNAGKILYEYTDTGKKIGDAYSNVVNSNLAKIVKDKVLTPISEKWMGTQKVGAFEFVPKKLLYDIPKKTLSRTGVANAGVSAGQSFVEGNYGESAKTITDELLYKGVKGSPLISPAKTVKDIGKVAGTYVDVATDAATTAIKSSEEVLENKSS